MTGNRKRDQRHPRVGSPCPGPRRRAAAERLVYFAAPGRHGGTGNKSWWLAGRLGGYATWDEYSEEFRLNGTAKMRFGDAGPVIVDGTGSPQSVITAPIGSLYLRTDGGTDTTLYRKESGTGATGWVASAAGGIASAVSFTPTGTIAATNVQTAIAEVASEAAAASGISWPKKYKTGRYYMVPSGDVSTETTIALVLDRLYLIPFPIGEALSIDRIAASVTTLGAAGAVVRLGLYASDADNFPAALVADFGTIDSTTTGYKELTISQSLSSGLLYWIGVAGQVVACTMRAPTIGVGAEWVSDASNSADARVCCYYQTPVTGAFPNPAVVSATAYSVPIQ